MSPSPQDQPDENPGVVTYDSLAGESVRDGGSFAANSSVRGPMDQPSRSVNTNTTDTSGAIRLDPASDAEAREAQGEWSESSQMRAGSQLGGIGGNDNDGNGGQMAGSQSTSGSSMPKGRNLQEGGISDDAPNASFTTGLGDKDDPARVAMGKFEADNAPVAGGAGPRDQQISGQRPQGFDALDDNVSA